MSEGGGRNLILALGLVGAVAVGLGTGYLLWGWPQDWYRADLAKLPPGPESALIRYGSELIVNTPRYLGKNAEDAANRYAGNDLACINCHLKAGLQPFAAPFVSTFATFPMMVDDQVLTLTQRINGCMRRSMNGKNLPVDSHEMEALIAYIKFVGTGTPESVRVAGMGLKSLPDPALTADATRGKEVYTQFCANCHQPDGQGERRAQPGIGYSIPPLWGDQSFNSGAGMAKTAYAAAYIRANMPFTISYREPVLTVQQAWDVATYMTAQPRPIEPPEDASRVR
jgi:thiosulfate dehydrogenase